MRKQSQCLNPKQQAIAALTDKKYLRICRNITGGNLLYKDLYQETILIILEMSEEKFSEVKCLECLFIKLADRQWNSSTSPFYYSHRKPITAIINEPDDEYDYEADKRTEEQLHLTHSEIKGSYWYDREIFKMFMELGGVRAVSRKTGIPKSSIALTINSIRKKIKEKL